jgi:transcriptional regulator with XRE-family HTH domain
MSEEQTDELPAELNKIVVQLGPDGTYYGQWLRRRLGRFGINQRDLARDLGKNPSQISRWVTTNPARRVLPELATIRRIERAMQELAGPFNWQFQVPREPSGVEKGKRGRG